MPPPAVATPHSATKPLPNTESHLRVLFACGLSHRFLSQGQPHLRGTFLWRLCWSVAITMLRNSTSSGIVLLCPFFCASLIEPPGRVLNEGRWHAHVPVTRKGPRALRGSCCPRSPPTHAWGRPPWRGAIYLCEATPSFFFSLCLRWPVARGPCIFCWLSGFFYAFQGASQVALTNPGRFGKLFLYLLSDRGATVAIPCEGRVPSALDIYCREHPTHTRQSGNTARKHGSTVSPPGHQKVIAAE